MYIYIYIYIYREREREREREIRIISKHSKFSFRAIGTFPKMLLLYNTGRYFSFYVIFFKASSPRFYFKTHFLIQDGVL